MTLIAVLALLAVGSWLLRIALVVLVPASRLPAAARESLDHLGPSVLAAVLVVGVVTTLHASPDTADAVGVAAAMGLVGAIAWRTRNAALTAAAALVAVAVLDLAL